MTDTCHICCGDGWVLNPDPDDRAFIRCDCQDSTANRLRKAISEESAAISPRTSELLEAAKAVLDEIERVKK